MQATTMNDGAIGTGREPASETRAVLLHEDACYLAYGKDLEYMWHWEIHRDGEFVQEGCSLSENSAREAVAHVVSFFRQQDNARSIPGDKTEEIHQLLRESGLGAPLAKDAGAGGA